MANNIQIVISADTAKAQVELAKVNAELRNTTKTLNDVTKQVGSGNPTEDQSKQLLASASQVVSLQTKRAALTREIRKDTEALIENNGAKISSRAATEGLVLVHETLSGNYRRMGGSLMIEGQALLGTERITKLVTAAMTPMGMAIGGAAIVTAAAAVSAYRYAEEQRKLTATVIGTGAASGLTTSQLQRAADAAASFSGQSESASLGAAEAFASAGVRSQAAIAQLSGDVQTYAELTGTKAADAQKALAEAMRDPVAGAKMLHEQLGILDGTQMEQIRIAAEMGDQQQAVAIILKAFQDRMDSANDSGIGLNSTWGNMKAGLHDLFDWLGKATGALIEFNKAQNEYNEAMGLYHKSQRGEALLTDEQKAYYNKKSEDAATLVGAQTPEGRGRTSLDQLKGEMAQVRDGLAAEILLHGANSEAAQRDRAALNDYAHAITTFLPQAEKMHRLARIDAQLEKARRGHDKASIENLTRQRTAVEHYGEVMNQADVAQAQDDAAAKAGESGAANPKSHSHGPSVVQEWEQQLHQQEVASGDFFRDQTANELSFWQAKLKLVAAGSKDGLAIKEKIYQAERTLARQGYQDHMADLDDRIEADHANWAKVQADWQEKLTFIAGKFSEESQEYKNAHREMLRAQRQHDAEELRETEQTIRRETELLKRQLDTKAQIREADAATAGQAIQARGASSPLGEIGAAIQIAQITRSLDEQKMADIETLHTAEASALDKAISDAAAKYQGDKSQYKELTDAKIAADQDYANQKALLEDQARNHTLQSILSVQGAYHSYIDGVVGATTSGFVGMIGGTSTWAQSVRGIYSSVLNLIDQQLARFVSNWIVQHLFMSAAQRGQLAVQTAAQVASEGAKTAATVVGTEARVAATAVGASQSAAITSKHNMKEITSHAATAAAAAYHAMAGIPVVGPVLGALAAAATFTAVEAFGALASFDKGTNYVPNDMVAQIHAGERIIPAADNAALMAAVQGGVANDNRRGGDAYHFHSSPNFAASMPFADQLRAHERHLFEMIQGGVRRGALKVGRT